MSRWIVFAVGAALIVGAFGCGRASDDATAAASVPMMEARSQRSLEPNAAPGVTSSLNGQVAQGWSAAGGEARVGSSSGDEPGQHVAAPTAPDNNSAPKPQLASYTPQRAVIRKATLSIRVTDVEKSEKTLDHETTEMGGYVDGATSTDLNSDHPQMDITVRVPAPRFDQALEKFEALGVSLSKTVSSEDVTGQLVDLDARMRTLGAEEETYRNLLRKVTKMADVIALQDKLTDVRSQLESMGSQRKTLGGLAALSTISVHLERSAEAVRPPVDPTWVGQTWGESTSQLGGLFRSVTAGAIWFIVFCPLWIPLAFLARWGIKSVIRQTAKPAVTIPEPPVR